MQLKFLPGNQLCKILKKLDLLEEMIPEEHRPYLVTLRALSDLKDMSVKVHVSLLPCLALSSLHAYHSPHSPSLLSSSRIFLLSAPFSLISFLSLSSPLLFQVNLPADYGAVLARWRAAWEALRLHTNRDISTINSIHVVNSHLEDWYQMTGDSLVKVSDHTAN